MSSAALRALFGIDVDDKVGMLALSALRSACVSKRPLEQMVLVISVENAFFAPKVEVVDMLHGISHALASRLARRTTRRGEVVALVLGESEPRLIGVPVGRLRAIFAEPPSVTNLKGSRQP